MGYGHITLGIIIRPGPLRGIDIEGDKIQRTGDDRHITGLDLGRVGAFLSQVFVNITAFHYGCEEHGILFPSRLFGRSYVLGCLHDGHVEHGIIGQTDLSPGLGMGTQCLDAETVSKDPMMANLIDRLPDPAKCLDRLASLIESGGGLIITSPYTWLEEYTPREKWLMDDEGSTLGALRKILSPNFELRQTLDLPFLIREHRRKYQWSVAEASVWRRR